MTLRIVTKLQSVFPDEVVLLFHNHTFPERFSK